MERIVRCQGVVLQDDCILLVKHINHPTSSVYWWLPGGGLQPDETQEECVIREIREETQLEVRVERLLVEIEDLDRRYTYQRYATYLCRPVSGEAAIGSESENSPTHSITAVGWYSIWDESCWEPGFYEEHLYSLLKSIQIALRAGV